MECKNCGGTGYDSAARRAGMMNAPSYLTPIGVWECDYCGGTGKEWEPPEMSEEAKARFSRDLKRALKHMEKIREHVQQHKES